MSLAKYKQKRNFEKTAEPAAGRGTARPGQLLYVIQKHAASRLHYDFRLELDGTLKSWAVPKGPSFDPGHKQLAVHVEDHPVAYGDFEGIIPHGEYGGGTVMLWDRGTWESIGDAEQNYADGKLKFTLHGEKLQGNWALIRMHGKAGDDGKNWLLIKEKDEYALPEDEYNVTAEAPRSVLSDRGLDEIAAAGDKVWTSKPAARKGAAKKRSAGRVDVHKSTSSHNPSPHPQPLSPEDRGEGRLKGIKGARKAPFPAELKPQLATLVSAAPDGDAWLHEMKFDGYRLLAHLQDGQVRLMTRNGNDWTKKFAPLAKAVGLLPVESAVLDGEVVLLREDGKPDFQRLQNALKASDSADFVYYLFDVPYCNGHDLRAARLIDRKQVLESLLKQVDPGNDGMLRYSDHIQGAGADVLRQSCRHELEGIVSKQLDSHYQSGRTKSWVKSKCLKRQEFVIGGYTRPSGARSGFGALLLGYHDNGELQYCGKVGTGFTDETLKQMLPALEKRSRKTCPFVKVPTAIKRQLASWTEPQLVAEVEFSEWTDDNALRHPSFKGLRDDKPAKQITRERAMTSPDRKSSSQIRSSKGIGKKGTRTSRVKSTDNSPPHPLPLSHEDRGEGSSKSRTQTDSGETQLAGVAITHPDRVLYPDANITKADLAQFYVDIADWILPHVIGRPLTLVRCPGGQTGQCFYQKHLDGNLPAGVSTIAIKEKQGTDDYLLIHDVTGLISLVQWGVLEFHTWGAREDNIELPDRLVFDLDPGEEATWEQVVNGVREVRDRLKTIGLESFLRTSGGKGLHVVVPLTRRRSWDEVKDFTHAIATSMMHDSPDLYIDTMSKAKRKGRIFIDYLRNGRGATAVASYSTRARAGAPVATPLRWDELSPSLKPNQYTVLNLRKRLSSLKDDPWEGFFQVRQSLTDARIQRVGRD
ncbi:DNA ligase D [Planctomicrobium piriforme]|nr:DNA ligase D [Planctomicrobium piriforme]